MSRKPSELPAPLTEISWPEATTLSASPVAAEGQAKLSPPAVTVEPGVTPASASAVAEKL